MLKIGIDELATERQKLIGYTFILVSNEAYEFLSKETENLKSKHKISVFHGKKYKTNQKECYSEFLRTIKSCIEIKNDSPSLLAVTLNTTNWNTEYNNFIDKLILKVTNNTVNITEHDRGIINSFLKYLLTFQHMCNHMELGHMSADVEIDSDDIKKLLSKVIAKKHDCSFSGKWLIRVFYNAYRKHQFPGAPSITESITPMSDAKSALIQAADVFANFLLSHLLVLAGHKSNKRREKSCILVDVFGDFVSIQDEELKKIRQVGNSDLDLDINGAITYRYGYQ